MSYNKTSSKPSNIKPLEPLNLNYDKIEILMICEALPERFDDYFYTSPDSLFVTNTVSAFQKAGVNVNSIADIVQKDVYLTVVVREMRKGGLPIPPRIIEGYSYQLEKELSLFKNLKVILLMGDTAIKAINYISKRTIKSKVIPTGSTYKIRVNEFYYGKIRVLPSYLQTGKNFLIEKSKQSMVAEDIKKAFEYCVKY